MRLAGKGKRVELSPCPVARLVGARKFNRWAFVGWLGWLEHYPHTPRGCEFNPWSGHILASQFRFQSGHVRKATDLMSMFFPLFLSPPTLSKIKNYILGWGLSKKRESANKKVYRVTTMLFSVQEGCKFLKGREYGFFAFVAPGLNIGEALEKLWWMEKWKRGG